jgi:Protein of unknown function (DUF4238)
MLPHPPMRETHPKRQSGTKGRNRRDHYLPQSYLRGFIGPEPADNERPLWGFDVPNGVWSERSPREVGYRHGFYDYATVEVALDSADDAFAELERGFPAIRSQLISAKFENWESHLDFMLRYAQMMRARSLLFFQAKEEEGKNLRAWVVEEISPDRRSVKVRSIEPEPLPRSFIRNWTITEMRAEIKKGPAWLRELNWALRYTERVDDPFVISEIPFMSYGPCGTLLDAVRHVDTLFFFPLCWQACLIGSRMVFDEPTGAFLHEDMRRVRRMYREAASMFVLSPIRVDFS